jgi:hypothetical protein
MVMATRRFAAVAQTARASNGKTRVWKKGTPQDSGFSSRDRRAGREERAPKAQRCRMDLEECE